MVEKMKKVPAAKTGKEKKKAESGGCSGQCWCCGEHADFDEEEYK